MCFRIDSCFGVHVHDDVDFYAPPPSATKGVAVAPPPRHSATAKAPALRDGSSYYSNGHQALHRGNAQYSTVAYHHQPAHADVDEASRRKRPAAPAPAAAAIGGHGYATGAYAAGGDETLKHPAARNSKAVAHGAGNGAQHYYYYEHEQPAGKDVSKDYYQPTPSAATSDLERY